MSPNVESTSPVPAAKSTAADAAGAKKQRKPRFKKIEHDYVVEPRIIQVIKKPKTFVDHSYRDFSIVPSDMKYTVPSEIESMSFSEKVHHMLSDERYNNWIQWLPHGRAFKITVPKRLEQSRVLQKYFGHNRFSSFLRQLNNHGFKHITRGSDRNSYYHECFLRDMNHLLKYMPPGRDARRLMPDPDNEPDFYAISRVCPLPSSKAPVAAASGLEMSAPNTATDAAPMGSLQLNSLMNQTPAQLPLGLSMQALQQPQGFQQQQQQHPPQQQFQQQQQQQPQMDASIYANLLNGAAGQVGNTNCNLPQGFPQGNNFSMMSNNNNNAAPMNNNNNNNNNMCMEPQAQQQQQLDDPALLALLLRSRGNSLFGLK